MTHRPHAATDDRALQAGGAQVTLRAHAATAHAHRQTGWRWLAGIALLALAACSPHDASEFTGYVEGEYVYLSVPVSGYLNALPVRRGMRVQPQQEIFSIAADLDQQNLAQANAQAQAAQQRDANLSDSRRPAEIRDAEANAQAARSALDLADSQLRRQRLLAAQQFVAELSVEEAENRQRLAQAQWDAAQAQLKLAREPIGRRAERSAATADYQASQSQAEQKKWLVDHSRAQAASDGEVSDLYFRAGEWVAAGKPVASLLPDAGRLIRFFVPEAALPKLQVGQRIAVVCDGCQGALPATVEVIYANAEYSPPVIYSQAQRDKLVFRVDARPNADAPRLPPGLPVTVRLP